VSQGLQVTTRLVTGDYNVSLYSSKQDKACKRSLLNSKRANQTNSNHQQELRIAIDEIIKNI
jgi:hypothetical protein